MSIMRSFALIACIGILSACTAFSSQSEIEALNEVQAVGSPFTQHLAEEYRLFANREADNEFDYADALHFARKGLAAARGEAVLPEPLSDWDLETPDMEMLSVERGRLLAVYNVGAREIAPKLSAMAQTRFDCWVEQEEEKTDTSDAIDCRNGFLTAVSELERIVEPTLKQVVEAPVATPAPAPAVLPPIDPMPMEPTEPLEPKDAMYLIFFDFDRAAVGSGGQSVLDAVADEIKGRSLSVVRVVGHTDSAGPKKYNERLSMKRAQSVKKGLIARGVDATVLQVEERGENDLLVSTADNIREPANRRVEITFK